MKKILSLLMLVLLAFSICSCSNFGKIYRPSSYNPYTPSVGDTNSDTVTDADVDADTDVSEKPSMTSLYGADSLEELFEEMLYLDYSNIYEYLTNLTYILDFESDEALLNCLEPTGRNKDAIVSTYRDMLMADDEYYCARIVVSDIVESKVPFSQIEINYEYALGEIDEIGDYEYLKEIFTEEFENIEGFWEIRGTLVLTKRSDENLIAAHTLGPGYYSEEVVPPFIFKIGGKYFLGFLWL